MPTMQIYGIDFTSAPRRQKPIVCAACRLEETTLYFDGLVLLDSFELFDNFLTTSGPWVAGFDFPFSQPRHLVRALGWPQRWDRLVEYVTALGARQFESELAAFMALRDPGDKYQYRRTGRLAGALSPMMMYGVPVGKMFFEGAPRLLRADVSVRPCRPSTSSRIAVEAYPALVARRFIGRRSYKNDVVAKQTCARRNSRAALVAALQTEALEQAYGIEAKLPDVLVRELVSDPKADSLDALLAAIQAAWAWLRHDDDFGLPPDVDPLEGWIVDPVLRTEDR